MFTAASMTGSVGEPGEWFSHNGSNRGFKCQFKGYPQKKAGYAILTNGDQGGRFTARLRRR